MEFGGGRRDQAGGLGHVGREFVEGKVAGKRQTCGMSARIPTQQPAAETPPPARLVMPGTLKYLYRPFI